LKNAAAAFSATALSLVLSGCGSVQWVRNPQVSESDCAASCDAHFAQCPQVFAGFPERGAVECPAEHNNCLKACAKEPRATRAAAMPAAPAVPTPVPSASPPASLPPPASVRTAPAPLAPASSITVASKEARLRELKHFYDEGLVSEDVYRDRQKAILSEP
jgi:hypothetical protein